MGIENPQWARFRYVTKRAADLTATQQTETTTEHKRNHMSNTIKLDAAPQAARPFLKSGAYSVRITSAEAKESGNGNQMLVLEMEIVAPEKVQDGEGREVKITGFGVTDRCMLSGNGAPFGFKKLGLMHKFIGLPQEVEVDDNNIPVLNVDDYKGKAFRVTLSTESKAMIDQNTNEPINDPETGEPIITNQYKVGRYLALDKDNCIDADKLAF
jgi:Protein of unknown function (DUF669)